jgi:hypothetical protein
MQPEDKPVKKTAKKIIKISLVVLLAVILIIFLLIPVVVSSEKTKQVILSKINSSVDGKADFASLSMSWWKGIKLKNITFRDNANLTSVQVKQIATKPNYASLLLGNLSFGETVIDQPMVEIKIKRSQPAEKSQNSPQQSSVHAGEKPKTIGLPVKQIDLIVKDGDFKVTDPQSGTVELSKINSQVNLRPPGQKTNFDINTVVVAENKESKIHVSGTGWTLEGLSGSVSVEVNDLSLASLAPLFALAGSDVQAQGDISANIKSEIKNGQLETSSGTITAKNIDVTAPVLKGDRLKTSVLNIAVQLQSNKESIKIDKFTVHTDWADINAGGIIPKNTKSLADIIKPDSGCDFKASVNCDLAAIFSQMPRTLGLKEKMTITAGKLNADIATSAEAGKRNIRGQLNISGLSGTMENKTVALSEPIQLKLNATSDKAGTINYDKLNFSSAFCTIDCTGTSAALQYKTQADLAKLQSEIGQFINMGPYEFSGQLFKEGTLSFSEKKISATGTSQISNLRITTQNGTALEPQANIDYSVIAEPAKNLTVNYINVKADFGQIALKDAVLPLGKEEKSFKLPLYVNIDLAKLQPLAALFVSLPPETKLAGTIDSKFSIAAKKDTYYIRTDSTEIKNLSIQSHGQAPFEQPQIQFDCDAQVNPVEKAFAVTWQLASPKIKIKGNLEQKTKGSETSLSGKADCDYDWAAVSSMASAFLPAGLIIEGQSKNTVNFSSRYPTDKPQQLLQNLNTKANIGFNRAEYMGLNFGPTAVDIQVQNGLLQIAPFSTTVNQGQFSFAGRADFRKQPTLFETPGQIDIVKNLKIDDTTSRTLLKYVNPLFANAVNVTGTANFNCEQLAIPLQADAKNNIKVIGTISLADVHLQSSDLLGQILSVAGGGITDQAITLHPTRFVLQDGFLRYDDMQIDIGTVPVNFAGVIGLDKSLNMKVTLPYTAAGKLVRTNEQSSGQRLTVALKGTLDKPQLDLGNLLQEQLKDQLLKRGLQQLLK